MSENFGDAVTPAAAAPTPAAAVVPGEGETTTSVLQLGMSPWMRVRMSSPAAAPEVDEGEAAGTTVEEARAAIMLKGVKSVEEKELASGARHERRVEKAEKEMALSEQEEENLRRCRWYFCIGCFGLPLLHFVSVIYFFRELKGYDGDFKIKKYVYLSLIVGIIESFMWILWVVIFQLLRDTNLSSVNILNSTLEVSSLA